MGQTKNYYLPPTSTVEIIESVMYVCLCDIVQLLEGLYFYIIYNLLKTTTQLTIGLKAGSVSRLRGFNTWVRSEIMRHYASVFKQARPAPVVNDNITTLSMVMLKCIWDIIMVTNLPHYFLFDPNILNESNGISWYDVVISICWHRSCTWCQMLTGTHCTIANVI